MIHSVLSEPKLVKAKEGWYVYIRHRISKKKKTFKLGLNYIKDLKERERQAKSLIKVLKQKINNNWCPFTNKTRATENVMLLSDALDFALEKKKKYLAPKTYLGYRGTSKFIKKAINDLFLDYLEIDENTLGKF